MAIYQPRDKFYHKARAQGLHSRAAFKLSEILSRYRLLSPGARVIDLGCAPGGWLAIIGRAVGARGQVVGIDLALCESIAPNVATIAGDLRDAAVMDAALARIGGPADLVTSDLAPKLTGIRARDEAAMRDLIDLALAFAARALRPGGAMVAKVFMSAEFKAIVSDFERRFRKVEVTRTEASRPGSAELYIIARDFQPARAPAQSGSGDREGDSDDGI
ncbi:MAG: RlmE family RNA methyltransferase [Candidatus Binataceae bacterium]